MTDPTWALILAWALALTLAAWWIDHDQKGPRP